MVEKANTNRKAVEALTLGILSIFIPVVGILLGIIGITFSVIAKKEIEKTNEDGRSFATSGMICSLVGISIQLFFVVLGIVSFYSGPIA
ncbi:DUF4190 domain-containing protein [Bacillaceae bacterium IKA-2]|nr:DUF4190 domain-containing protein [Bacillaceae bacterium IKA-2]